MDPAEVSAALHIEPTRSWRAGEPRQTPKDTPLEGVWPGTYWTANVYEGACPDKTLADALGELVDRFSTHKDFFRRVWSEGGKAEFYVFWYVDGNRGGKLESGLLGQLSDLSVNLLIDIYPPTNPSDEF
jgi:hypothetical protein